MGDSSAELREELRGLKDLLEVARVVVSSLELDRVLQSILDHAMDLMEMPAGSIALFEEEYSQLTMHAHAGLSETFVARRRWRVHEGGLTHRLLQQRDVFVVKDTRETDYFSNPQVHDEGIRSLIALPLAAQEKVVGILYLDDFIPRRFSSVSLRLFSILGSFAALSIDNARMHEKTRLLACTDGLTGLYNHRQFQELFAKELSRAERYRKPLSLLMLDVDDFKKFNDTYGHPAGDRVLVTVAQILRRSLRQLDLACRYGGEEFIALLPETNMEKALGAAQRVRLAIAAEATSELGKAVSGGITVSVGVANFPRDGRDAETLLDIVDGLLYRAKKEGKNKVYHLP